MKLFILSVFCIAVAAALPVEIVTSQDGEQYYLVPLQREKRGTWWGISDSGYSLGQRGTLFDSDNHRFEGSVLAGKDYGSRSLRPDHVGGQLDYLNKPSGSTAFISADRTRGYGTDVNAGVKYNIYKTKDVAVDVTGQYERHFGGPGGTGHADTAVFLNAEAKI